MIENIDYIVCQICKKQFRHIGTHIQKIHHLSRWEYLNQFPNAKLVCEDRRKVTVGDNNGSKSLQARLKISTSKLGKKRIVTWDPGKGNRGRVQSEEEKTKRSITLRKHYKEHPESRYRQTPLSKNKIRQTLVKKYANGEIPITTSYKWSHKEYCDSLLQGKIFLKSSTEKSYVNQINKQSDFGKSFIWLYEAVHFLLQDKNKQRTLTPDFLLLFDWNIDRILKEFGTLDLSKDQIQDMISRSGDRRIEEVKGYWNEKHIGYPKWTLFRNQYPEENAEIVTTETINSLTRGIRGTRLGF